jgi:hypothetical protein
MQIYSRACIGRDDETVTGDWKAHGGRRRSLQKSSYWAAYRVMVRG